MNAHMVRRLPLLLTFAIGGALFGAAVSHIPSPDDPALFWIGNFSAPWVMLPFLSGRAQRSWLWAAGAGLVADVACVIGFYAAFLTMDPARLGMPSSAGVADRLLTGISNWATFIAPWVVLAMATGLVYGLLGCWWGRSRSLVAAAAVVAPFAAEPWLWRMYRGFLPGPGSLWLGEIAVGLVVVAWLLRERSRPARSRP